MVQGAANSGPTPEARTVTLEVDESEAQGVQVAVRLGRLSLSVRPADGPTSKSSVRGPIGTTWASDVSPALANDVPAPPAAAHVMKVWQSTGDGRDFKF
jgi:Flp pilus assembly protein CpaB